MVVEGYTATLICVRDLETSIHFYCDLLGMKLVHRAESSGRPDVEEYHAHLFNMPQVRYRSARLAVEETPVAIELLQYEVPASRPKPQDHLWTDVGYVRLSFRVKDVNATYQELKAKGVRFVAPPASRPTGGGNLLAYDPDGNVIGFSQPMRSP